MQYFCLFLSLFSEQVTMQSIWIILLDFYLFCITIHGTLGVGGIAIILIGPWGNPGFNPLKVNSLLADLPGYHLEILCTRTSLFVTENTKPSSDRRTKFSPSKSSQNAHPYISQLHYSALLWLSELVIAWACCQLLQWWLTDNWCCRMILDYSDITMDLLNDNCPLCTNGWYSYYSSCEISYIMFYWYER